MSWTIRPATVADCEELALIGAATFLETFAGVLDGAAIVAHCRKAHDPGAYRDYLAQGAKAWLAEMDEGGAPVGFALLGRPDLPGAGPGDLELKRIYSLSRFHGRGLGAALMARAVDEALRQGADRLLLGVYAENRRARAFYGKSGFELIGDRKFRVGDREYGDVVLAKALGRPAATP